MGKKKISLHSERGQSLIEFAFALVVLMILLAGLVDASRALFTYLAMRDAAQEGALYGSVNPTDTAGIVARACNSSTVMQDLCNDPNALEVASVTPTLDGAACAGNGITVQVSVQRFPLIMPFIGVFIGNQWVPISASVTDTILSPMCS